MIRRYYSWLIYIYKSSIPSRNAGIIKQNILHCKYIFPDNNPGILSKDGSPQIFHSEIIGSTGGIPDNYGLCRNY